MGHNVGAAADRAVKNSERVKPAEMTREQWIVELRKNLKAGLFIPSHQTEALIAAHDELQEKLESMTNNRDQRLKELLDAGAEIKELQRLLLEATNSIVPDDPEASA